MFVPLKHSFLGKSYISATEICTPLKLLPTTHGSNQLEVHSLRASFANEGCFLFIALCTHNNIVAVLDQSGFRQRNELYPNPD